MSPERQRLAIAKSLGLKLFHEGRTVHGALWASRDGKNWFYTKDWFSDLNAVRAAIVGKFDDIDRILYALTLRNIVLNQPDNNDQAIDFNELFSVVNATAAQHL